VFTAKWKAFIIGEALERKIIKHTNIDNFEYFTMLLNLKHNVLFLKLFDHIKVFIIISNIFF